jgi:hypothetical protein
MSELLAAPAEWLPSLVDDAAEMAGAAVADFSACYVRELSSLQLPFPILVRRPAGLLLTAAYYADDRGSPRHA